MLEAHSFQKGSKMILNWMQEMGCYSSAAENPAKYTAYILTSKASIQSKKKAKVCNEGLSEGEKQKKSVIKKII